jgi:hypothetical protein
LRLEGGHIVEIRNIGPADTQSNLRGGMKVTNAPAAGDTFTQSDQTEGGFLHRIGDKIKRLFSREEEPPKERGGWFRKPDGSGSEWRTESNPPPPRDSHGRWIIDTACGAADWYWVRDTGPADAPVYGPGYKPSAPAEKPPEKK